MRNVLGALCAVLVMAGVPYGVSAQGALPGVPVSAAPFPPLCFGWPEPASAKPSISAGYVWDSRQTDYSFTADGPGIEGVTERRIQSDLSAVCVSGSMPVIMRNMGGMVLSGSWAIPSRSDARADDFNPPGTQLGGRTWTGITTWATAETLLAYSIRPGLSGVAGYRWDYWQTGYDDPEDVSAGFIAAAATDSADFCMETLDALLRSCLQSFGSAIVVYRGYHIQWPRSNTKKCAMAAESKGWIPLKETWTSPTFLRLSANFTVASGLIRGQTRATLSVFGKYNYLKTETNLTGRRTGTISAEDTFDFEIKRELFVAGAEASVNF